jgi:predicted transcriptional regulator
LLVAQIVRNYVSNNGTPPGELPTLIATVHQALADAGKPGDAPALKPAVAINRSYGRDFVICLDCGWRGQMLRRHLTTAHASSPSDYRTRWNLKDTHPLTAPGYSERRSTLAIQLGLDLHRSGAEAAPEPTAPKPRGRPRTTTTAPPIP